MDCLELLQQFKGKIDLIIADPPYEFKAMGGGVHKVGGGGAIKYQDIIDIDTNHFDFDKYIPALLDIMGNKVNAYFFCNKTLVPKYLNEAEKRNLNFDILCIRKINPIPAKGASYLPELEYIIFLRSPRVYWDNGRRLENYKKVFDTKIGGQNEFHPNQKPLELIKRFALNSCPIDGIIFDPFMGSGTTGVAAVKTNRNFIGCDINKKYVDIANKRILESQQQNNVSDWL